MDQFVGLWKFPQKSTLDIGAIDLVRTQPKGEGDPKIRAQCMCICLYSNNHIKGRGLKPACILHQSPKLWPKCTFHYS